jgi:hypothetical protein
MSLKYSRKRDKVYLRKLHYLKRFLSLLNAYRAHLWRQHLRRSSNLKAIKQRYQNSLFVSRQRHCQFFVTNTTFYRSHNVTKTSEIILYVYGLRVSVTSFITTPGFHFIELSELDKFYEIDLRRLRGNFLIVCEMENDVKKIQSNSFQRRCHAGQMLVNWFIQSLQTVANALTTDLNDNDQNVLAYQFCNSLLSAGVIRKLDETSTTEPGFKVGLKIEIF